MSCKKCENEADPTKRCGASSLRFEPTREQLAGACEAGFERIGGWKLPVLTDEQAKELSEAMGRPGGDD